MPVIAAIFPRETQDDAINIGNYMPFIATIIPRETQDFASLQGGRQHCFKIKQTIWIVHTGRMAAAALPERDMALTWRADEKEKAISGKPPMANISVSLCSGTQDWTGDLMIMNHAL